MEVTNAYPGIKNTSEIGFTLKASIFSGWPVALLIVSIAGMLGNILVFVVVLKREFRRLSMGVYLMSLALADNCILLVLSYEFFGHYIISNSGVFTHFECRLIDGLYYVFGSWGSWIIAVITAERMYSVLYPFKAVRFNNAKVAIRVVIVVLLLVSPYGAVTFLTATAVSGDFCKAYINDLSFTSSVILNVIHCLLYVLFPFLIIVVCNIILVIKLRSHETFRKENMGEAAQRGTVHLSIMLICLGIEYGLTMVPLAVIWPLYNLDLLPSGLIHIQTLYNTACMLEVINHGINFYLYCLTGSQFRKGLVSLCSRPADNKQVKRLNKRDVTQASNIHM